MITYMYYCLQCYYYLEYSRGGWRLEVGGWRLVVGGRGGRGGRYLGVGVHSAFGHICPVSYSLRNVFAYSHIFDPLPSVVRLQDPPQLQASARVSVLTSFPLLHGSLS